MADLEVGLSTLFCLGERFERMLKLIEGFDVSFVELVDDGYHELSEERVRVLRRLAEAKGIRYGVHTPFAGVNIATPIREIREATLNRLKRSITNASQLDCEVWVLHPGLHTALDRFYPNLDWRMNLEAVEELIEHAEEVGVTISIENTPICIPFILRTVEHFKKFYVDLKRDLKMTLDIGHAHINGEIREFFSEFRDKIIYIHAHDNDGKSDLHQAIGYGTINWEMVANVIKNSGYRGVITVESVEHVEESVKRLRSLLS